MGPGDGAGVPMTLGSRENMLEIKDLHAEIDGKEILRGFNLTVPKGEVHAIMGPNGSGKSTLAYVLSGKDDYEVTGGSITWDGKDLLAMSPDERSHGAVPRLPISDGNSWRRLADVSSRRDECAA